MQLLGQGGPSPSAAMRKTLLLSSFACIDLSWLNFKDYSCKTLPPYSMMLKTLFHPTPAHRPLGFLHLHKRVSLLKYAYTKYNI